MKKLIDKLLYSLCSDPIKFLICKIEALESWDSEDAYYTYKLEDFWDFLAARTFTKLEQYAVRRVLTRIEIERTKRIIYEVFMR